VIVVLVVGERPGIGFAEGVRYQSVGRAWYVGKHVERFGLHIVSSDPSDGGVVAGDRNEELAAGTKELRLHFE
jgi:hypothetical protein